MLDKNRIIVGKHIEGITINGLEYLLNGHNKIKSFATKEAARKHLLTHGLTSEYIDDSIVFKTIAEYEAEMEQEKELYGVVPGDIVYGYDVNFQVGEIWEGDVLALASGMFVDRDGYEILNYGYTLEKRGEYRVFKSQESRDMYYETQKNNNNFEQGDAIEKLDEFEQGSSIRSL